MFAGFDFEVMWLRCFVGFLYLLCLFVFSLILTCLLRCFLFDVVTYVCCLVRGLFIVCFSCLFGLDWFASIGCYWLWQMLDCWVGCLFWLFIVWLLCCCLFSCRLYACDFVLEILRNWWLEVAFNMHDCLCLLYCMCLLVV